MMGVRLARLPVNWKEQPLLFERYWDESMTTIEKGFNNTEPSIVTRAKGRFIYG